jgi:hypothetical protein
VGHQYNEDTDGSHGLPPLLVINYAIWIASTHKEDQRGGLKVDPVFREILAVFRLISFEAHGL